MPEPSKPQVFLPPPEAAAAMAVIPGMRMEPGMLILQDGPACDQGPEAAGAILFLQATFVSEEGARCFWEAATPLMAKLADAPGFIRRYSFGAYNSINLIALWRTIEDAEAFAASPEHRQASHDLFEQRWQQSHFAGLWELRNNRGRVFFCEACDGTTLAPATTCRSCGAPIIDVYRLTSIAG